MVFVKPGVTPRSRAKLRSMSPDPATRTSASPTWTMTSALRDRCFATPDVAARPEEDVALLASLGEHRTP